MNKSKQNQVKLVLEVSGLFCPCSEIPTLHIDCAGFDIRCKCGRVTESCVSMSEARRLWQKKYMHDQ